MKRRQFLTAAGAGAMGLMAGRSLPAFGVGSTKPNFILLLSDDQNWGGLSVRMDPLIEGSFNADVRTPRIAQLAAEGMRFTDGYASAPVCSPTRAALQTGMSPAQLHWTKAGPSVRGSRYRLLTPKQNRRLADDTVSIAHLLGEAGYRCAHYGKWHLRSGGPQRFGYHDSDGETGNETVSQFGPPNPVDIFGMGQRAATFMREAVGAGQPFFVQMSYYALHGAQQALPETVAACRQRMPHARDREVMAAALAENLDTGVGLLLDEVKRMGMADNTYVIYMGDNGGGGRGHALRGGKGSLLEGGIRVPFIVRGPGIAADSVCRVPVVGHDFLPTFCALAGVREVLPAGIEGGDISGLFTGGAAEVKRRFPGLAFHFPHYQAAVPHSALRVGDYKFIRNYETGEPRLYDLANDLYESNDLSAKMPEKTAEMAGLLDDYLADVHAQIPAVNPDYQPTG